MHAAFLIKPIHHHQKLRTFTIESLTHGEIAENVNPKTVIFPKTFRTILSTMIGLSFASCSLFGNGFAFALSESFPELNRYESALNELKRLDTNWDNIVQGKGDNIRRCLGTVYTPPKCESPLCSFPIFTEKFVRAHLEDLDVDAFEEPNSALLTALNQADFLAYSSVFSEYGNGGGGADYIDLSHKQVKKSIVSMQEIIDVLKR
eukprot:gene11320-23689_t